MLAKVREQDPKMYIVPFMLGEAEIAKKDWSAAESEFKQCLDLNPNFDQAMTGLSRALLYQNKDEEAKQWARNALKYNPENYRAWYQLGFLETKTDKPAAIADYEKAVAMQGNFAPLRRDLGLPIEAGFLRSSQIQGEVKNQLGMAGDFAEGSSRWSNCLACALNGLSGNALTKSCNCAAASVFLPCCNNKFTNCRRACAITGLNWIALRRAASASCNLPIRISNDPRRKCPSAESGCRRMPSPRNFCASAISPVSM